MREYIGNYAIELCSIDGYKRKRKRKKKKKQQPQDSLSRYEKITG